MYNPVKDGIKKTVQSVRYTEATPPRDLSELVHCFWELKTESVLPDDFCLHVLPDACVNILFNMADPPTATNSQKDNGLFSSRLSQSITPATVIQRTLLGVLRRPVPLHSLV